MEIEIKTQDVQVYTNGRFTKLENVVVRTEDEYKALVKLVAHETWLNCANAHRMYPENKHNFSDYWDTVKFNKT